ncbi:uncharacterized protein NFIA_035820 [Aspergillus fischeri NRRL 181]|uniref:Uncharacterized protein n=1 Tax=Neosartorya fischeri (strain ATCC 1020 / DSM 3700 / CBS 544.65 / FGSC A1164 / JCM 1740 / NRRL 181 / WB 181) TaxID=331117 RepID=A1CZ44_NEOFI|nr:uncharacterized protein NFIA_035820 [Aspergillus fischeri NRRL 181]EAW24014.1 hypothetical protein NFIA_035820 [Aspergillus fischeri NRRL 181]
MDLSQPPQPFLDPGVWERMKAAGRDASRVPSAEREEGEEERRRRREREAEFGQMANKKQMHVNPRQISCRLVLVVIS